MQSAGTSNNMMLSMKQKYQDRISSMNLGIGGKSGAERDGDWQLVHPYDAYENTQLYSNTPQATYNDEGFFTQYSNSNKFATGESMFKNGKSVEME